MGGEYDILRTAITCLWCYGIQQHSEEVGADLNNAFLLVSATVQSV